MLRQHNALTMASSGTVIGYASLIGQTLGKYEVIALIGRGAMGTVYLARDISLNRHVALKVLLGSLARNPELVKRFHNEAQAAAPLRHPNIVQIYAAGVEGGVPYIAMEYVEGEPLDRFLRRQGRVPWQTALYIGQQVSDALDCAHRHNVIHRDVKPANILLDSHGKARLTDFGIANVALRDVALEQSNFVGTLHYMSPEQCAGKDVGPMSDLYSLGVTLYFMIAGRLPFDSDSPVTLIKSITNDDAPRLNKLFPDVPDDVARLVAHLMTKDPAGRPPSAAAVSRTIERLQAEKGGRSAMPEALRAFMQEQTRIRPVRTLVKPGAGVDMEALLKASRRPIPFRAFLVRLISVLATLIVFSSIPILTEFISRPTPPASPSVPLLQNYVFRETSVLMRQAQISLPSFQLESIRWIGRMPAVLVLATGIPGSATHGSAGILAVDCNERRCISVLTPAGPGTEPYFWQIRTPLLGTCPPVYAPQGTLLQDLVVFPQMSLSTRGDQEYVQIVGRRWDRPSEEIKLLQIPLENWQPPFHATWAFASAGFVIPKPDGKALCTVLNEPPGTANYLIEYEIPQISVSPSGKRLTSGGRRIVPWSIRYSPTGKQIAYLRETSREGRELWVFAFTRDKLNGSPVALGVAGDDVAFSPDEMLLALQVQRERDVPEIRVISAANGAVQAHLGSGILGPTPWHPSGKYLVAADKGRVWAIEVDQPHRRYPLSPEDRVITRGPVVSPDGEWVAAVQDNAAERTLLFIRTARVTFEDIPQ
ncbi:MAG TPA: protein kinase [Candidatus Hydrogenedentes bacterium]|nr:protein kinase [Candidatus Hydrogenedentota bacterium]HOL77720.1 protein kinase [Candidatus Hydrogenedentota bacterium]HPO86843.1 protein kinase [Candidatus Hydrogenedentota bacterium]